MIKYRWVEGPFQPAKPVKVIGDSNIFNNSCFNNSVELMHDLSSTTWETMNEKSVPPTAHVTANKLRARKREKRLRKWKKDSKSSSFIDFCSDFKSFELDSSHLAVTWSRGSSTFSFFFLAVYNRNQLFSFNVSARSEQSSSRDQQQQEKVSSKSSGRGRRQKLFRLQGVKWFFSHRFGFPDTSRILVVPFVLLL